MLLKKMVERIYRVIIMLTLCDASVFSQNRTWLSLGALFYPTLTVEMAAGLCGLVTSAMYDIGVGMTMEVMVYSLPLLLMLETRQTLGI